MIAGSKLKSTNTSKVAREVETLARKHNINDLMTSIDYVANKFAELSGNDVNEDKVLRLSIKLARHDIISKNKAMSFIHRHLLSNR